MVRSRRCPSDACGYAALTCSHGQHRSCNRPGFPAVVRMPVTGLSFATGQFRRSATVRALQAEFHNARGSLPARRRCGAGRLPRPARDVHIPVRSPIGAHRHDRVVGSRREAFCCEVQRDLPVAPALCRRLRRARLLRGRPVGRTVRVHDAKAGLILRLRPRAQMSDNVTTPSRRASALWAEAAICGASKCAPSDWRALGTFLTYSGLLDTSSARIQRDFGMCRRSGRA